MSEVIANINPEMPHGYEKLDGLEIIKQKDGSLRYNGVLELGDSDSKIKRRIQLPELDEVWGFEASEFEAYNKNPEVWNQGLLINQLISRLDVLEQRNQSLEQEIAELREKPSHSPIIAPEMESTEPVDPEDIVLVSRLTDEQPEAVIQDTSYTSEFDIKDSVKVMSEDNRLIIGTVASGVWQAQDGEYYITVLADGNAIYVQPDELAGMQSLEVEDEPVEVIPAVMEERNIWERRRAGIAAGAAALIGIIGLAYIAHEVEENEHRQTVPQRIENSTADIKADQYANKLAENGNRLALQDQNINKSILRSNRYRNRLLEQTKKVVVQERNATRRTNFLLSDIPRTSGERTDTSGQSAGYPWNWSAKQYGERQAENQLHKLAKKAQMAGHQVKWSTSISSGRRLEILSIDGKTKTSYIIGVLNKFK